MDAVEEVRSRVIIEDVIGEYVPLKRSGRNWKGLSPFSDEKTPSFVVSPDKQIWKDFSSGKGGSAFDFIMEVEGVDFKGALELLARKVGVDLDQYGSRGSKSGPNKERLYELLDLAAKFYQVQFSKNKDALNYVLKERGFSKGTALEWRLGYSPNNGSALIKFAESKGFNRNELQQAGLTAANYRGGVQDMFRGRLMIPLQDAQGRVIGFTARSMPGDDPKAPKYINTPQTVLYDKSRHVYGLHLAKEAIRKSTYAVLVEGNLDVIASHGAGVRQVVATAGTALTEPHLKTLSRFTDDIRLCFDADKAGINATERAIPIASRVKISLSIINIPSGKDPDELIKLDPEAWKQAINQNQYALDWLVDRYEKLLDIQSARGKRQFSDVLLPVVRSLSDEVERDHYLNLIAKKTDTSREALDQKFEKTPSNVEPTRQRQIKTTPAKIDKLSVENNKIQDRFLSLVLLRQTLREFIQIITAEMLFSDQAKELLEFLKNNSDYDLQTDDKKLKTVSNLADYVKIETLLYEELYQGLELNELYDEAARLQAHLVKKFVETEKIKLSELQRNASDADIRELQEQDKQYNLLLNQVKGAFNG